MTNGQDRYWAKWEKGEIEKGDKRMGEEGKNRTKWEEVGFFKKEARRGQHHYFQIVYRFYVLINLYIHVNEQETFCTE